jgi:glycerophosphoryl diester phosphodiesterase
VVDSTADARSIETSAVLSAAWADLRACWRVLAGIALLYAGLAGVVLLPLIGLLFQFLIARTHTSAVADVDIAWFFLTTAPGWIALILVGGLIAAVTAIEQACLMCGGLGRARGVTVRVRDAFLLIATRSAPLLGLTTLLVLRVLAIVLPFAAAGVAVYWFGLRQYDINYYLSDRPETFWVAALIFGFVALALLVVVIRVMSAWLLVLPLVAFVRVPPRQAFAESQRRMRGHKRAVALSLAIWALLAIAIPMAVTPLMQALGRLVAPLFGESLVGLLAFVGVIAVTWLGVGFVISVLVAALFAMICTRWYLATAREGDAVSLRYTEKQAAPRVRALYRSWGAVVLLIVLSVPAAAASAYFLMQEDWVDRPVLVFAHRGASEAAPENTLAAFRRAGEEHTDYVELDVQETADGVVVVAHDSDLMKVARSPLKIWASTAAQLRAVDIGSYLSPAYADQRVPTLAEALEVCKGVSRVDIELKDYGHDQQLEERVIALVEAAGMQKQIVTMSLSQRMVTKMKRLRPEWTSGLLIAKALGNVSRLPADFLAVESRMATRKMIRAAHAAHKPVYVWTVNDSERMIRLMGLGVDGLITNRPGLGKEAVASYADMSAAQRLFLFIMTRLGVREEISEPEGDLRP